MVMAALGIAASATAENYPYRSDVLWVTVPNHADWLYKTGEKATVDVMLLKYGMPMEGTLDYALADDLGKDEQKGQTVLKNGRATIQMGTRKTPGFRDLRLTMKDGRQTYRHHIKVGFSPELIKPVTNEPSDFQSYWQKALDDLKKVPLKYTLEPHKPFCTDKADCFVLKLNISSEGQAMYGWLFVPKNAKPGSCPVVLSPPGAGVKTVKDGLNRIYYTEQGCIRLNIDIHGLDPRMPEQYFTEVRTMTEGRNRGYLHIGMENRDQYYMRHVYLGLIRCIDFLTQMPEWDGKNVIVQGGSQGGALSLVAAGLDRRVTQCVANHPALADMAGIGYPHFASLSKQQIETLAYYDVVNFARHIECPTYLTWGYNDDVCPPTTSYAVWNTLKCPKESLITPINEHWTSETTNHGQLDWILEKMKK